MEEIWQVVKDYEDLYEVSTLGNVRNINKTPKSKTNSKEYYVIKVSKLGISKQLKVSRVVAVAFIPNPENKPFINHIDCDTLNNRVDNLEWCTPKENSEHASKLGRIHKHLGVKNSQAKLTPEIVNELRNKYIRGVYGYKKLAKEFGLSSVTVYKVISELTWKTLPKKN